MSSVVQALQVSCPSCGASVAIDQRFARVVVCGYCRSTIRFGDGAAEVLGKMAVLPAGKSALYVGATGRYSGSAFEVIGRVRYHWSRGYWDEWFVTREDGQFGWLSEDEGRMSWEAEGSVVSAPPWDSCRLGGGLSLGGSQWTIAELDEAVCAGGEGQLPFSIGVGDRTPFADVVDANGRVATLEWGDSPQSALLFEGQPLLPSQLSLSRQRDAFDADLPEARKSLAGGVDFLTALSGDVRCTHCRYCGGGIEVIPRAGLWPEKVRCPYCGQVEDFGPNQAPCPSCGGSIQIRTGDEAAIATCGSCSSVVDIRRGSSIGEAPESQRPMAALSVGDSVTLRGIAYEVAGWLRYEGRDDEDQWNWDEWLLHAPGGNSVWLVLSDGHASLSRRLPFGPDLEPWAADLPKSVSFEGRKFRRKAPISIGSLIWVEGELPWVAIRGDRSRSVEFGASPYGLSAEWSEREIEWFATEHLSRKDLKSAVQRPELLPKATGVGLLQPYPRIAAAANWWLGSVAACSFVMLFAAGVPGRVVATEDITSEVYSDEGATIGPFSISTGELIELEITSSVDQGWAAFALDLLPEDDSQSGAALSLETSYYSGVEDGESWSEGSRTDSVVLKHEGPDGNFMLQVAGEWGAGDSLLASTEGAGPSTLVQVKAGVWLQRYFGGAFGVSFFFFLGLMIHRLVFERLRGTGETWSDMSS